MSRRTVSLLVAALLVAVPARAQFVVIDPGNLAQAILIADRTLQEYDTLIQQYQTIRRMAQGLGSLDRYRVPTIGITGHDPGRWVYGAPWLQGLNVGDARGTLYEQTARRLERPGGLLDPLPPAARKAIEDAYATIEITDSIAEIGGHQVALVRGYSGRLQQATQAFEQDVLNTQSGYHEMTAVLDKVAAGELLARRQDMATNQLLSHALEQLLARSKRMRDTEAATMNMRLLGMRDGRTAGANLIRGAADDLRTWRQP
jgi:conjugal transfer/entry exclusion protein